MGSLYQAELTLNLADHYDLQKIHSTETNAERKNDSFSYEPHGLLNNNLFEILPR